MTALAGLESLPADLMSVAPRAMVRPASLPGGVVPETKNGARFPGRRRRALSAVRRYSAAWLVLADGLSSAWAAMAVRTPSA